EDQLNPQLPAGKHATDYHQRLGMADFEVLSGHLEVRGEGAWNTWETPTVGALEATTGYAEAKYSSSFGGYLAGRFDVLRFGQIKAPVGDSVHRARLALLELPVDLLARPALEGLAVHRDDHVEPVEPGLVGGRAHQDLTCDHRAPEPREQGAEARDAVALGEAPAGLEVERAPRVVERAAEALEHAVADVARDLLAPDAAAAVERERSHRLGPRIGADAEAGEPAPRAGEAAAHSAAHDLHLAPLLRAEQPARAHS